MEKDVYVVSACLAGQCCRYDAKSNYNPGLAVFLEKSGKEAIYVCPEQLGGLSTPREKSEIQNGKSGEDVLKDEAAVLSETGRDVTKAFVDGAYEALGMIGTRGIAGAILKSKSPSCGCGRIYDGSFSGRLIDGNGVFAALLIEKGVRVAGEDQYFVFDTRKEQE